VFVPAEVRVKLGVEFFLFHLGIVISILHDIVALKACIGCFLYCPFILKVSFHAL
jgi:hypothetical protein